MEKWPIWKLSRYFDFWSNFWKRASIPDSRCLYSRGLHHELFCNIFAVLPALWAIAVPVAAATGLSPAILRTGIVVGAIGAGSASPMSSGGAANLSISHRKAAWYEP